MSQWPAPLEAGELMATSRDMAGFGLIDEAAVEPLGVLVDSVNAESELHEPGSEPSGSGD